MFACSLVTNFPESTVCGQRLHAVHTGGTFGTRLLFWLVTNTSCLQAQVITSFNKTLQVFTFYIVFYRGPSYFNFIVRVVTTRLLHLVKNKYNK